MVYDNEMIEDPRSLTHEATTLFIKDDISHNQQPELYDLDQEFANTKKNKNKVVIISLIAFTLVFSLTALIITKYIEIKNSKIPISITAFEDINLREIFDKAKQYENEMKDATRELDDIYTQRDQVINTLTTDAENSIKLIEANNPQDKVAQINRVNSILNSKVKEEDAIWSEKIISVKEKIKTIQEKIDSYDTRILEKAKEQEDIINNQQKRFDLELEKSVNYYEGKIDTLKKDHVQQLVSINSANKELIAALKANNDAYVLSLEEKYNPEFSSDFDYINTIEGSKPRAHITTNDISSTIYREGVLLEEETDEMIENINKSKQLFSRLLEIPYNNSPSKAIGFLEMKYYQSIQDYKDLLYKVTPVINNKNSLIFERNSELDQINYFLTTYVKTNRINGLIIDPRAKEIKIFIDPIYQIRNGTIGYIFRNDSDFIGTIRMQTKDGALIGTLVNLVDKKRGFDPFDKILINLK